MSSLFSTCRKTTLKLLNQHSQGIIAKAASFLGGVCRSDCTDLSEKQLQWISRLFKRKDLPPLSKQALHKKEEDDAENHRFGKPLSPAQRGYGTDHKRRRAILLRREPYYRSCAQNGLKFVANIPDHIQPKCLQGSDGFGNLQSLCEPCSRSKPVYEGRMMRDIYARERLEDAGQGRLFG